MVKFKSTDMGRKMLGEITIEGFSPKAGGSDTSKLSITYAPHFEKIYMTESSSGFMGEFDAWELLSKIALLSECIALGQSHRIFHNPKAVKSIFLKLADENGEVKASDFIAYIEGPQRK